MRVMVMIEGDGVDEDKIAMTEEAFAAMSAYNEQLVNAGIMLDGDGLKPTSAGARIVFEGGTTSVVDGPFTEAKEIIAGYWIWEVSSLEEAIEWAKKCPTDPNATGRQLLEDPAVLRDGGFRRGVHARTPGTGEQASRAHRRAARFEVSPR